ncbi:response regulator transcription factor [Sphingobacterium kitahiroshimense]|uniref:LytR/AlgR family response regulator transcription factor n=1 Tax=Sphingobacterium sp. B16(2022) TaxID=2914044 RepID=UPI00143A9AF2|nr:response regulator [Sphingobacterium sp. B16(2022)]NJI71990.1 response regulator transcription factor [Sphingobacterium sp. B16(2022)]
MRKVYCVIADDEELAREVIENYISKVNELVLVASCSNGSEVYNVLQNNTIDLLFLDIEMPELTGIALLKTLKNLPAVIITTAYREYAVEGFDLNVLDYLLKPISFERFLKAIDKFMDKRGNIETQIRSFANVQHDPEAFIYVRSENKMVRLLLNDILFIEGLK